MNINLSHIDEAWKTSGINLIYFGDIHHRAKAPSSRIDDFIKTEKEKVAQLRFLAREFNAKAFIQPGDFLDSPNASEPLMNTIMDWWGFSAFKEARKKYDAGEIDKMTYAEQLLDYTPIIGIVGNHELYGNSIKSFNRTSLNFLSKSGFITLVDRDAPYIIKGDNGLEVAITGGHFDMKLNKFRDEADLSYYEQDKKYGDVDIFLTHGYLSGEEIKDPYSILVKDLNTKADITINGHIHDGFPWVKIGKQMFGNPGAIAQQSTSTSELDRVVQATLIHIEDDGSFDIVDIPLDLPEPEEIFNIDEKEEKIQNEKRLERVKSVIDSIDQNTGTNTSAIIKAVAQEEGVSSDIRDLALEKTYEMMKEMGANKPLESNVDYRLKSITLHNFESHQHTVIDLDSTTSPTLVIGESSQGKSSILRGIYWVLENQGDAKSFVRRKKGVRDAYVELERMDGTKVKRFVEVSKSRSTGELKPKKNGYIVTEPNGDEHEYNTGGLSYAQEVFGLNYLQLDDKDSIPINFQKQEDGWYFIGLTDSQRAKVIGALYGTQYITSAIKELNKETGKLNQEAKLVKSEIKDISEQLESMKHIDNIESQYNQLSKHIDKLSQDDKNYTEMVAIYKEWHSADQSYAKLNQFIEKSKPILDRSKIAIAQLEHQNSILKSAHDEYQRVISAQKELAMCEKFKRVNIKDLQDHYQEITTNESNYNQMVDIFKELDQLLSEMRVIGSLMKNKKSIIKLKTDYQWIYDKDVQYNRLREVYNERLRLTKEYKELTVLIDNLKEEILELNKEFDRKRKGLFTYVDYGIVKVYKPGGEDNMELKELNAKIEKLNNDIIVAETQAKVNKKQIELSNQKLKELGINPENARDEILAYKEELDTKYKKLVESLETIQQELDN